MGVGELALHVADADWVPGVTWHPEHPPLYMTLQTPKHG